MSIDNTLSESINNIFEKNDNYGKNNIGANKKINIEISNNKEKLSLDDIRILVYIDNLSRIMKYCQYEVEKEYYIDNMNNNLIDNLKKELDYYRINIDTYSTKKELEDNYIVEDLLTKLKYENNCYIENNELLLKSENKTILIDNDSFYTDDCFDITHIYTKRDKKYHKVLIFSNKSNNIDIETLENILDIPNKTINIIPYSTSNEDNYNIIDINKFRFDCLIYNSKYPISEEELKNITTINNKIENYIKKNTHNLDESNTLSDNITYNILNKLIEFENNIIQACNEKNPTIVLNYLIELTNLASNLIKEEIKNDTTINLLKMVQIVNNNGLKLIGIIPRDEI